MHAFAHIADVHLGANRDPLMAQYEANAFLRALDVCVERKVDFILICGDLFHLGVPSDLGIVNQAVIKMREVTSQGIPIYAIYGSHDYTPTGTCMVDLLESAGMITKVAKLRMAEGKLSLDYIEDKQTGAKLVGISGRKSSIERAYYQKLNTESLERLRGFKIFAFHIGLDEFKPGYLKQMDTVSITSFPKGFDYYAGGHIHEHSENSWPGYQRVVFPGALSVGYGRDFENTAKGTKRGFYMIRFADEVVDLEFVNTPLPDSVYYEDDLSELNSYEAQRRLEEALSQLDVSDKLVVLKLKGVLSTGKTSDMNFTALRTMLLDNGATQVHINRYALQSEEYDGVIVADEGTEAIEERVFKKNIGILKTSIPALKGDVGLKLSLDLLRTLRQEQRKRESNNSYKERMLEEALEILSLKSLFDL